MVPTRISPGEVKRRLDFGEPIFFIDTRTADAWENSSIKIPGARRIPYSEMEKHLFEIPRNRMIVTYCTLPEEASSVRAAQILQNKGFKQVYPLQGGFNAWVEAGYPLAPKSADAPES